MAIVVDVLDLSLQETKYESRSYVLERMWSTRVASKRLVLISEWENVDCLDEEVHKTNHCSLEVQDTPEQSKIHHHAGVYTLHFLKKAS